MTQAIDVSGLSQESIERLISIADIFRGLESTPMPRKTTELKSGEYKHWAARLAEEFGVTGTNLDLSRDGIIGDHN